MPVSSGSGPPPPEIPTWLSLVLIAVTLLVTTATSLRAGQRDAAR